MLDQNMTISSPPIDIGRAQRNNSGGTSNDDMSYVGSFAGSPLVCTSFVEYSHQDLSGNERHSIESARAVVHDPGFKQFAESQMTMTTTNSTSSSDDPPSTNKLVQLERDVALLPGETKIRVTGDETCAIQGGTLMLTNYRLLFLTDSPSQFVSVFTLTEIECLDFREPNQILISMKGGRMERFDFLTAEEKVIWHRTLTKIVARLNCKSKENKGGEEPNEVNDVFAWRFAEEIAKRSDVDWLKKDNESGFDEMLEQDFKRLSMEEKFRISSVNEKFEICQTYPQKIIVPKTISDENIREAASYRGLNRLPAVVWKCPRTNSILLRSAQPQVGILAWGNLNDEKLIEEAVKATRKEDEENKQFVILDARTYAAAFANRARSGGFENTENYQQAKLEFLCLPNIHTVRNSFIAIRNLLHNAPHTDQLLASLQNTGWLQNMSNLLISSSNCADYLSNGHSVLVHCSDGWDRTTQIVSLAKLMLDHHYRTIEGFAELIQREWVEFGHKFYDRQQSFNGNWDAGERSPIFLQFLEAVRHLHHEQPAAFEFTHAYLIKLAQHAYSGLFGTFLFNCEKERKTALENRGIELVDVWSYLGRHNEEFVSELYDETITGRLKTMNFSVLNLRVWHEVFSDDEERYTNLYPANSSGKENEERPASGCATTISNSASLIKSKSSERLNDVNTSNGSISHSGSNGAICSADGGAGTSTSNELMNTSMQQTVGSNGWERRGTIKEMLDRDGLIMYHDDNQEVMRKKRKHLINSIKQKDEVIEELRNGHRLSESVIAPHFYNSDDRAHSISEYEIDSLNFLQKCSSDISFVELKELDYNPSSLSKEKERHCRNCGAIVCDTCSLNQMRSLDSDVLSREEKDVVGSSSDGAALSRTSSLSDLPFSQSAHKSTSFPTCPSPSSISLNMTPQTPASYPVQSSCKSSSNSINSPHNSPGEFSRHGSSQAVKG